MQTARCSTLGDLLSSGPTDVHTLGSPPYADRGNVLFLGLSAKGREGGDLAVEKGKWLPGGVSEADLRAPQEMLP